MKMDFEKLALFKTTYASRWNTKKDEAYA